MSLRNLGAVYNSDRTKRARVYYDPDLMEYTVELHEQIDTFNTQNFIHIYNADYCTNDKADAFGTAKEMVE